MRMSKTQFLWLATLFEGGLGGLAFLLGALFGIDPLEHFRPEAESLPDSLLATLVLYGMFALAYRFQFTHPIRQFLIDKMGSLLAGCSLIELTYLGCLAGVTEELLFRGFLQPWLEIQWGWLGGWIFSNLIFALLHWITPLYALLAGLCGLYLGLVLDLGAERNLFNPMLVHALYDVLAFIAIVRAWRSAELGKS